MGSYYPMPFTEGDDVVMMEEGFSIPAGEVKKVAWVRWVPEIKCWCCGFGSKKDQFGFRAGRFMRADKFFSKKDSVAMKAKNFHYAIYEANMDSGEPVPRCESGMNYTGDDITGVMEGLAKNNPHKTYIYGRLTGMVRVDAPPVKFETI